MQCFEAVFPVIWRQPTNLLFASVLASLCANLSLAGYSQQATRLRDDVYFAIAGLEIATADEAEVSSGSAAITYFVRPYSLHAITNTLGTLLIFYVSALAREDMDGPYTVAVTAVVNRYVELVLGEKRH